MRTNPSWKDWFVFSKKERNTVAVLLVVFVSYCLFIAFYNPETKPAVVENLDEKFIALSLQKSNSKDSGLDNIALEDATSSNDQKAKPEVQLFNFDPNTLDESGFQKLGLQSKIIHTILNYRSKGGRFYKPDDLRKIYGLQHDEADRLISYVKIDALQNKPGYSHDNADGYKTASVYNKPKPHAIDVNSATADEWKTLPAIGDVLSNRIVKYRDKIGGFTSLDQVKKTYGLSDSAYQAIAPYLSLSAGKSVVPVTNSSSSAPKKININIASANELKSNPAVPAEVAEAIVVYRGQHGKYSSVEGIKKIVFINDELYQKIAPLLTAE